MAATKVLVVDDDLNIQRVLVFTLKQEGYEVHVASDGQAGVEMAASIQPDLILMDVAMPKLDGYAATQKIRAAEQPGEHVPIIMLTAEADVEQRVRGLRAGADDDIVKPFHPLELIARIKALLARSGRGQQPKPGTEKVSLGRLACFYGAKGGVGTTTLAINTAIAAHRELKRSVCLVDANLQFGDHRVFLDLGPDSRSIVDAVSASSVDLDMLRQSVVRHETGVELLLAPSSPEHAELVSQSQHHLLKVVEILRSLYELVILDMDERFDDHLLDVIGIADRLVVVLTADLSCVKNVRLVLETMTQLQVPQERLMLVLNRANAFTGISVKSVENVLKRPIEHQVVNDYRSAISALNSGTPFMAKRPDSALGKDVLELARLIDKPAAATVELKALELSPVR